MSVQLEEEAGLNMENTIEQKKLRDLLWLIKISVGSFFPPIPSTKILRSRSIVKKNKNLSLLLLSFFIQSRCFARQWKWILDDFLFPPLTCRWASALVSVSFLKSCLQIFWALVNLADFIKLTYLSFLGNVVGFDF